MGYETGPPVFFRPDIIKAGAGEQFEVMIELQRGEDAEGGSEIITTVFEVREPDGDQFRIDAEVVGETNMCAYAGLPRVKTIVVFAGMVFPAVVTCAQDAV